MKKLYIIHGWTYTIEPWEKTVQLLKSQGLEVCQLRVPGLTTPSDKVWTIDDYVEWLRDEIGEEKEPIVLGHSNGGRIALNYLTKYPGSIKHLILLSSAGVDYQPTGLRLKRSISKTVSIIGKPLAKIPLLRRVFYRLIGSDYGRAPENMKKTLSNMIDSDRTLDLSRVKVDKTDILWGREDHVTPIAMAKILNQQIPSSTLEEFDGWAHAPYLTHPEELARAILDRVSR